MTLVEMLMAIAIFAIGVEGFALLLSKSFKINSYALEMGQSSMAVSQGVNHVLNYIRGTRQADNGAYAIKSANDNDLVLYSDYDKDGATERLHFYKNGQDILMGITEPSGSMPKTYSSGDQQTKIIASHIVNGDGEPIFYYYDKNYSGDPSDDPLNTPAAVSGIRLVEIHLKINIDPNRAPDNVEMRSFVEMRNLNDYDRVH